MKKIFLTLITVIFLATMGFAQGSMSRGVTTLLSSFDLSLISGSDTSFYWQSPKSDWGLTAVWTGVSGTGTCEIKLSNDDNVANTFNYDSVDPISFSITGATGSASYVRSRTGLAYFQIKITKSSLSAGNLTIKINVY